MRFLLPALCLGALLSPLGAHAAPQLLDKVVAIVDQGVVLDSEITEMSAEIERNARAANQPLPPQSVLREQVLEQLIQRQLQLQIAGRMGLRVSDAQLDQTLRGMAEDKQMTVAQMQQQISAEGSNWEQFREQIRQEIMLGDVRRINVQRRVTVTPQEVEGLAQQLRSQENANLEFHIGHIRIEIPDEASNDEVAAGRKRAEEVVASLKAGADFRQTAIAVSSGAKALEGGDWGWMNINEMPTLFAETVANASSGQLFGPIRSGSGFHLIKVFGVRGGKQVEVTEFRVRHILLKPSVILSDARAEQLLSGWAAEIRKDKRRFGELARKNSEDPGSAANDGELNWATADTYVPEFQKMVTTLPQGQVSDPFRTEFGWHILEVLEQRTRDVAESHLKDRAYRLLFNRKFMEQQQLWLQEMRSQAYIEVVKDPNAG